MKTYHGSLTKDEKKVYKNFGNTDRKFYTISYFIEDAKKWMEENQDLVDFFVIDKKDESRALSYLLSTNRYLNSVKKRFILDYWYCTESQTKVLRDIKSRYEKAEKYFYAKRFNNPDYRVLLEFIMRKILDVRFDEWKDKSFKWREIYIGSWKKEVDICREFLQSYHPEVFL
jgi:spermidine synthase